MIQLNFPVPARSALAHSRTIAPVLRHAVKPVFSSCKSLVETCTIGVYLNLNVSQSISSKMPFTPAFRARLGSGPFMNQYKTMQDLTAKNSRSAKKLKKLIKEYDEVRKDSLEYSTMEYAVESGNRENARLRAKLAETKAKLAEAELSVTNGKLKQVKWEVQIAEENLDELADKLCETEGKLEEASAELAKVEEKIRSKREALENAMDWLESDSDA